MHSECVLMSTLHKQYGCYDNGLQVLDMCSVGVPMNWYISKSLYNNKHQLLEKYLLCYYTSPPLC